MGGRLLLIVHQSGLIALTVLDVRKQTGGCFIKEKSKKVSECPVLYTCKYTDKQ